ncbi:MAG: thermonuclease family protein [Rhizobiaceae bacterium]
MNKGSFGASVWFLTLAGALVSPAAAQQTDKILSGYGYAVDGNTLAIGADSIRITGVMAPLLNQRGEDQIARSYPAGLYARDVLASFVAERPIACRVVPQHSKEKDGQGRYFGICAAGQTQDIGAALVQRGWAIVDRSGDTAAYGNYAELESLAKASRFGIWQGPIQLPWLAADASSPSPSTEAEPAQ